MTELAHIIPKHFASAPEQRRSKLHDALSGIPPAKHQQEFAAALAMDKERRVELRSRFDELSTEQLERLLSLTQRVGLSKIAESQP